MKVLILSSRARIILKYSCLSTVVIFENQIKNVVAHVHLIPWSLERSPEKVQALSGSLAAHSYLSFDRCLLHWRPPCSALGRFLGRLYSTYSSRTPLVPFSGPVVFLLSAGGYRQISTGHEVLALARPVVPHSLALSSKRARPVASLAPSADRCSSPSSSLQGCCPSSQALLSFTNFK